MVPVSPGPCVPVSARAMMPRHPPANRNKLRRRAGEQRCDQKQPVFHVIFSDVSGLVAGGGEVGLFYVV